MASVVVFFNKWQLTFFSLFSLFVPTAVAMESLSAGTNDFILKIAGAFLTKWF